MARGSQEDLLPDGPTIHQLRASRISWEDIGKRYGVSRQAAHKKWKMWTEREAKAGRTVENPFPRQKRGSNTKTPAQITAGGDASSDVDMNDASPAVASGA